MILVKEVLLEECIGINLYASTPLRVCRNQPIHCYKMIKGVNM